MLCLPCVLMNNININFFQKHPHFSGTLTLYFPFLPFSVCLSLYFLSPCVGRSSASCAWLRTDRQTRCLSARNSSRKTAGKSARLPRTKSWSWNCTRSVCGQMDVWLRDGERRREGEWENVLLFEISVHVSSHTIHVTTLVSNVYSRVWNFCSALLLKYVPG